MHCRIFIEGIPRTGISCPISGRSAGSATSSSASAASASAAPAEAAAAHATGSAASALKLAYVCVNNTWQRCIPWSRTYRHALLDSKSRARSHCLRRDQTRRLDHQPMGCMGKPWPHVDRHLASTGLHKGSHGRGVDPGHQGILDVECCLSIGIAQKVRSVHVSYMHLHNDACASH